jgi:hypothetical protein
MSLYLPTGVSVDDFLKTWHSLDYGASTDEGPKSETSDTPLPPTSRKFVQPASTIQHLRKLAQKGRLAELQLNDNEAPVEWGMNIEDAFETSDGFGHVIFRDSENAFANESRSEERELKVSP